MKIKTAIIGLGRITHGYESDALALFGMKFATHLSAISGHKGFELIAGSDVSAEARDGFKIATTKYKSDVAIYLDWQKMVHEVKPELVVVATNTDSHVLICNKLIDLGVKNILCEKPIALSVKDAETLVKKAKKKGCNLFVNYFRAYNPTYIDLIEKIHSGFLGKIQTFDVKYHKGLLNNGTHFIDLLVRMFGDVKGVQGFKDRTIPAFGKDLTLSAVLEFKNGVSGCLRGMNGNFYNILELDILGELGRVRIVNEKAEFYLPEKSDKVAGYTSLKLQSKPSLTNIKEGLYPVYNNIHSCISSGDFTKNRCSGEDSLNSLKIAYRIVKSAKK